MDAARLKSIPAFAGLSYEELGHIAALAAEVSAPAGKELVREGDYSYDVLAILDGTATVEHDGEHGSRAGTCASSRRPPRPPSSRSAPWSPRVARRRSSVAAGGWR